MEIWRDIKNYEDYYQVSLQGRVRSLDRMLQSKQNGGKRLMHGKILSQAISKTGYCVVSLFKNGKGKTFKVHRLIATEFIKNIENKPYINHIDGNKLNNSFSNLEWCTAKENTNHAFSIGIMDNNKSKKQVYCIDLDITKDSISSMAEYLIDNNYINSSKSNIITGISNVCMNKRKGYYKYKFEWSKQ